MFIKGNGLLLVFLMDIVRFYCLHGRATWRYEYLAWLVEVWSLVNLLSTRVLTFLAL